LGPFLFWKLLFHSRHTSCTRWAKFRKTAIWGIISHFERQGLFVVLFNTIFYNCILRSQQCWCVIFFLTSTCSTSAVFGKKKLSTKLMMCCVILQEWILRANFNPRTLPFFLKNADHHVFWYQQCKLLVTKMTQKIRATNTVYSVARFCRNHLQQIVAEGWSLLSCILQYSSVLRNNFRGTMIYKKSTIPVSIPHTMCKIYNEASIKEFLCLFIYWYLWTNTTGDWWRHELNRHFLLW